MTASPVTNVSAHTVGYIPDFDPANYTEQLSADNAKKLVESGIPLNFATEVIGIRTAAVVEDLPEDLSVYANATGTVFPLRCADGRVVHQLRKDNVPPPSPGKKSPKYLQAKGTGALITVHPNQEARVGNVSRVWIVEGTKQAVCAAFYAPEDVLVVGIQGCANWTSEGVGVPDLGQIVLDGAEVAILFDADRTSKRAVYDAGTNLATYLTSLGAASVSFAARAGVGTAGLDDVLGGLPFARRASFLANLVAIGNEKPGRRPAAPVKTKTKASMYCDMSTGTTRTVADDDEPSQVKLDAAARIAEVLNMADPDNPDKIIAPVLKLEVAMPSEEGTDVFQATITSEKLTDIGAWLDQHPSGTSVIINRPSDLKERNEIANAIRSCDNENLITVHAVPRTGWTPIDGEQRYLHQGGALGADGNITTWRAHLPIRYRAIDFAKAAEKAMDPIELRAAVRSVIDAADLLIDQTPWWCGLGGIAIAQSGAVPNTAVGIVAEKSAGKLLPLWTRIPTPTGWTTMGQLAVGDQVVGRDGKPCTVVAVSNVDPEPELFDVVLNDGQTIRACADHQWIISRRVDRERANTLDRRTAVANWERKTAIAARLNEMEAAADAHEVSTREVFDAVAPLRFEGFGTQHAVAKLLTDTAIQPIRVVRRRRFFHLDQSLAALAEYVGRRAGERPASGDVERVMTTRQMIDEGVIGGGVAASFSIRLPKPLDLAEANDLPVEPYLLGVFLGDGGSTHGTITVGDDDLDNMVANISAVWPNLTVVRKRTANMVTLHRPEPDLCGWGHNAEIREHTGYLWCRTCHNTRRANRRVGRSDARDQRWNVPFSTKLDEAGLLGTKKIIPTAYFRASADQRLSLLQGIMDTDGSVDKVGCCELTLCNEDLALGALELIRSLGIKASMTSSPSAITEDDPERPGQKRRRIVGTRWRIHFATNTPVFRLERKAKRLKSTLAQRSSMLYVQAINPAPSEPGRCIQVDSPDSSYLVGEGYVPTHNTLCLTTLTSFLSPDFAYRRRIMAVADGTANAVDLAMNGLDNSFLLVDDWHPEIDVRERIRQAKSLDGILRRVHGAPSKARAMIDRQVDGVVLAPVNNSHPFLMLSMERLPARQDAESMLDRMLTISLTAAKTFRRGDAAKMEQLGQSGLPQIANVGLLMWIADLIREQDPEDPISAMQQWIASIDESRNRITSVMSDRSLTSSARGTQVAAAMMAGVELWLDFAEYVGAVTTQESNEIGDRVISTLLDACAAHTDLAMGGNTSESINLIRDLKAALTAGELTLDTPQGGQRRLGKITTVNGTKCIAILTNRTFAGIDAGMVEAALRPIVIQYKEKNRVRYTHQVLFPAFEADDDFGADTPANSGGHRIRCFCIALDVWDEA